jgi:N-formylglutamate amidohydrolase
LDDLPVISQERCVHFAPSVVRSIVSGQYLLRTEGYSVALNVPFAGALTPLKLYRNESRLRSIMIEVRRNLYMDEQTGSMLPTFDTIKQHVAEGIERIGGRRTLKARRTRV